MADSKNKTDRLHDLLPKHLNTRGNTNWNGLLKAIGEQDQLTADLISEVRNQLFIKTASRPYLDRLAANNKIARPRLVGMDDTSFRDYIPVLSYYPKQVKLIIDQLLDIFFFKESTTAYITSSTYSPFILQNGHELEYSVDENQVERITFVTSDFANINAAKASEIVAAINRQAKHSYATVQFDSATRNSYVRLFTKTIGSKGSLRLVGGRANIAFKFSDFIATAGNGNNTQWAVTKVGDVVTFEHVGGTSPGIDQLQVDDVIICNLTGNVGSFPIKTIDLSTGKLTFTNLFGTAGSFTQSSVDDVKFMRPVKHVAYTNDRRAMTWETSPSEIVVEMPTSPPVVKRSLKGSFHLNGTFGLMASRNSDSSLTLQDAGGFPNSGTFWLEQVNELKSRYLTPTENTVTTKTSNTRLQGNSQKYTYTSRTALTTTGDIALGDNSITNLASTVGLTVGQTVFMDGVPGYATVTGILGSTATISNPATQTAVGVSVAFGGNTLSGISPALPAAASLNEVSLTNLTRTSNIVTATTSTAHGYSVGENVIISGSSGIITLTTTGDTTSGSDQLTNLASTMGLAPSQVITGAGIPVGTTILSIAGSTVTMSANATASGIGVSVAFGESLNGSFVLASASGFTFTFSQVGSNGSATLFGTARVERIGLAASGSKVILTSAVHSDTTRIKGSYAWDLSAPFVLSSKMGSITDTVQASRVTRILNLTDNSLESEGGFVMFDYGLNTQEGPVRYLYKPTANTIALDPSYVFQYDHAPGTTIIAINNKGPHRMSDNGAEYAPYVTDPSEARVTLQELIRSVKSAGIFVNFLVRYPEQLYGTLDVYNSGVNI
jgi:hypothetical protein